MSGVPQYGLDALRGVVSGAGLTTLPSPTPASDGPLPAGVQASGEQAPDEQAPDEQAPDETGRDLVRRTQEGDTEAFGELYDRYLDTVYRYVAYRVGSHPLAEDLTSETFLRALRAIGTFSWQGRDPRAWLVTIARNLIADHYRSSRYRLELVTEDVGAPPGSAGTALQDGPEDAVLAGLEADALLDAVRRLRPQQQECVSLRFLQGLSVAETAAVMGKKDAAVKALTHRAVRSLGRLLAEGGS